MIIYFTDDQWRDEELIRQLHETRTLHRVCEVRNDADLRKAMVLAIGGHEQLVLSSSASWLMRKLEFAFDLVGLTSQKAHKYMELAGPRAATNASVRATHDALQPCGLLG